MTLNLQAIEQMANTCDSGGHVVPCATVLELVGEVRAWRERFPAHVYRPQDRCVALRMESSQMEAV